MSKQLYMKLYKFLKINLYHYITHNLDLVHCFEVVVIAIIILMHLFLIYSMLILLYYAFSIVIHLSILFF